MYAEMQAADVFVSLIGRGLEQVVRISGTAVEVGARHIIYPMALYAYCNHVGGRPKEIASNPEVSLCNTFHTFSGKAYNAGHPLKSENSEIRSKLIKVFEPWYFAHNNENDENMCYVRVKLESGFFHKDGTGYKVNFSEKTAEEFPFTPQIEMIH